MARAIIVDLDGTESCFACRKLDRGAFYDKRQRLAVDAQGQRRQRAALTRDGRCLLRADMTAQAGNRA